MKRFVRVLKRTLIIITTFILLLTAVVFIYMQQPQFGKSPSGERLKRIMQSANFKDDKEGLKTATTAIDKWDEFYKVGMEAVFAVQDFGTNFKSSLKELEKAQK